MNLLDRALIKAFAEAPPRVPERHVRPAVATMLGGGPRAPETKSQIAPPADQHVAASDAKAGGPPRANSPLSTFTAEAGDSVRAQLEVDHLAWPAACDALLARASERLNHFVDGLVERAKQGQKTLAVASCRRGEGRTTLCLLLAKLLGARALRPVVVDADAQNPHLARCCGIEDHAGWSDVLDGKRAWGEALIASIGDGVTLMPWRGPAIDVGELAGSTRAHAGFAMLREQYDLLLLDTVPLADQTAVSQLADFAEWIHLDATYLVHDARVTTCRQLADTAAALRRAGVHVEGAIENFVSSSDTGFGPAEATDPIAPRPFAA